MTTRLWDRAAVAVVSEGRRFPAVVSLSPGDPTVQELFDFIEPSFQHRQMGLRIIKNAEVCRGDPRKILVP